MQSTLLQAPSITVSIRKALPLHSSRRAPSLSEVRSLAIPAGCQALPLAQAMLGVQLLPWLRPYHDAGARYMKI